MVTVLNVHLHTRPIYSRQAVATLRVFSQDSVLRFQTRG
jgi:hypothetical protein